MELEDTYKQIQADMKKGKSKKNDEALEKLEEGLREAIISNFNLLKEVTLS